jgi:MerR family transcriptional regulator, light-induced transcriptional regulator
LFNPQISLKAFLLNTRISMEMTNKSSGLNFLNSIEVSKMLGVNVSTVKRWTDEGSLSCNKTIGGHRKFLMAHLADFVEKNKITNPKVEIFSLENETDLRISYNIVRRNYDELIAKTVEYALAGDRDRVQRILNGLYLSQVPLYSIFDDLVTPVMQNLGDSWANNKLRVIEEHIATQTIRDSIIRLQGIIKSSRKIIGKALLINPSQELHDLSLKMVDHILEERGFNVFFSGQITPVKMADEIFTKYQPDRLYISSTFIEDKSQAQKEINKLFKIAGQFNTKIFVGGQGFDDLKIPDSMDIKRLYSFQEVLDS